MRRRHLLAGGLADKGIAAVEERQCSKPGLIVYRPKAERLITGEMLDTATL
jgi:hypothetical protein